METEARVVASGGMAVAAEQVEVANDSFWTMKRGSAPEPGSVAGTVASTSASIRRRGEDDEHQRAATPSAAARRCADCQRVWSRAGAAAAADTYYICTARHSTIQLVKGNRAR